MNCEEIQSRLSLLIDERLDEKEQVSVNQHLEDCPICREYYGKLLKLQSMADEFEIGGDKDYWISQKDKIMDRIEQAESEQVTPVQPRRSREIFYRIAAVAAAVALVASISIFESRQVEPVRGIFYRERPSGEISDVVKKEKRGLAEGEDTTSLQYIKVEAEPLAEEAAIEEQSKEYADRATPEPEKIAKIGIPLPVDSAAMGPKEKVAPGEGVIAFDTEIKQQRELPEMDKIIAMPEPIAIQADEFTISEEMAAEETEVKPREIISEVTPESEAAFKKGEELLSEEAAEAPVKDKSKVDQVGIFQIADAPAKSLMDEIVVSGDTESLRYSALPDTVKIESQKKAADFRAKESAESRIEIPLVDVDEPVLGVTRASLDPSIFGDFSEEQKQQYVELRHKVDWYNSNYAFIYSPPSAKPAAEAPMNFSSPRRERMAEAPVRPTEDSLQAIAYSMAEAFHGLGIMTPIKNECSRMLDLMKKLRKQADDELMIKLDIYIGELEDRLD